MGEYMYILVDGIPTVEPDAIKWANWFSVIENRRVDFTVIGDVEISTVFLGLNHSFGLTDKPVLYETMVFGGKHDGHCQRYCTREEAIAGHSLCVDMVGGTPYPGFTND